MQTWVGTVTELIPPNYGIVDGDSYFASQIVMGNPPQVMLLFQYIFALRCAWTYKNAACDCVILSTFLEPCAAQQDVPRLSCTAAQQSNPHFLFINEVASVLRQVYLLFHVCCRDFPHFLFARSKAAIGLYNILLNEHVQAKLPASYRLTTPSVNCAIIKHLQHRFNAAVTFHIRHSF